MYLGLGMFAAICEVYWYDKSLTDSIQLVNCFCVEREINDSFQVVVFANI